MKSINVPRKFKVFALELTSERKKERSWNRFILKYQNMPENHKIERLIAKWCKKSLWKLKIIMSQSVVRSVFLS